MNPSDIDPFAERCYSRGSLAGFIDGSIRIEGERFSISPVEAAATEQSLQCVENNQNILVETSFPTDSIPVALGVALTYKQNPRRGGDNKPVVIFPRLSYVTTFDKIHFSRTINPDTTPESEPIPRHPAGSCSEIGTGWGLWTTNNQFIFDLEFYSGELAVVVIDLRAPRWLDTYAPQLEALLDHFADTNAIFIAQTGQYGLGYELAEARSDLQVNISPEHLASSPINEVPVPQRTPLSTTEELIAIKNIEYHYYGVGDEELAELYPRFAAKKIELQEREVAPKAVGGLYNRLIQLPIKPKYWNKVSASHGYFDAIPQQIEHLSIIADQYESGASRLENYIETARQVQAHLNDEHQLQNYLLNIIERAEESVERVRFVFGNEREQEAFLLAAEKNGYRLGTTEHITFSTKGVIKPVQGVMTVFAGAPPRNSHHYEFPASEQIVFIYFSILDEYIKTRGQEGAADSVSHSEHVLGTSDIDLEPIDLDQIEAKVEQVVAPADTQYTASDVASDLLGDTSPWEVEDQSDSSDEESDSNETDETLPESGASGTKQVRIFEFEEGHASIKSAPLSRVTLFHPERGEIERTRAQNVDVGDTILLIKDVADDLYDLVLDTAREREQIREDENLVEGWRDQLNTALDSERWTRKDFHNQLVEMGSNISDPSTISQWRHGDILAPSDQEDIRRVYQLSRPGIDTSMFEQLASEVDNAADRLRRRHRKIGRRIRSLVEYELDASTTDQPDYYDEEMRRRIREDTQRLTVINIREETIESSTNEDPGSVEGASSPQPDDKASN